MHYSTLLTLAGLAATALAGPIPGTQRAGFVPVPELPFHRTTEGYKPIMAKALAARQAGDRVLCSKTGEMLPRCKTVKRDIMDDLDGYPGGYGSGWPNKRNAIDDYEEPKRVRVTPEKERKYWERPEVQAEMKFVHVTEKDLDRFDLWKKHGAIDENDMIQQGELDQLRHLNEEIDEIPPVTTVTDEETPVDPETDKENEEYTTSPEDQAAIDKELTQLLYENYKISEIVDKNFKEYKSQGLIDEDGYIISAELGETLTKYVKDHAQELAGPYDDEVKQILWEDYRVQEIVDKNYNDYKEQGDIDEYGLISYELRKILTNYVKHHGQPEFLITSEDYDWLKENNGFDSEDGFTPEA